MKNYATRRMWVKRSKKSWMAVTWLTYKLVSTPLKIILSPLIGLYRMRQDIGTFATILILVLAGMIFWMVGDLMYRVLVTSQVATPEQIVKVRRVDSCQDNTILMRAAEKKTPLLVRDLDQVEEDCKKYWQDLEHQKKQEGALKKQLEALK